MKRTFEFLIFLECRCDDDYFGFFRMGVGPPSWILCTELVVQRNRSLVQSMCYASNAVVVAVTTFTILPLYEAIGNLAFLILFAAPSAASIFILYRYLPETKGREIYAIVADLKTSSDWFTLNDLLFCIKLFIKMLKKQPSTKKKYKLCA